MAPLLSVLLPVRNGAAFLEEALRSVTGQTFGDFELIAVDDGSTDETPRLLEEAKRKDPRLRIVKGPAQGIAAALNAGLAACRAPFIARMDADDVCLPERFAVQLATLEADPTLAAVGSQVEIFPRERLAGGFLAYEGWLNSLTSKEAVRRDCLVESPLVHPAAMIRAAALREVGGFTSAGWPEDYALWLALLAKGHALSNVPQVLLRWRDHDARLTRTHADYALRSHVRLKAHHLATAVLKAPRCILWGAGKTGRLFFRALKERGVSVELFVDIDPKKIGRPLHGIPVVGMQELPPYSGTFLVAAVGAKGARAEIREFLDARGWVEGEHYCCVG